MSITFSIEGQDVDYEAKPGESGSDWLNLSNGNARDLLDWLGFADESLWEGDGLLFAPVLAAQCAARLRLMPGNVDAERPACEVRGRGGCLLIECGRRQGYLMDRAEELLRLAEKAGLLGFIQFS